MSPIDLNEECRERALAELRARHSEEQLWNCIVLFRGCSFKTFSGLDFSYALKKGRNDAYTRELWIDRCENSKSLVWSSVTLAYRNLQTLNGVIDRPKALGDIRGISYIYGIFYRFGLMDVPEKIKEKMSIKVDGE